MTPISFVDQLRKINVRCSEFVNLSLPLYKALAWTSYGTIDRVKVRFKKRPDFAWLLDDLTQDTVSERYVQTRTRVYSDGDAQSTYYVFPTNGFRSLWSVPHHDISVQLSQAAAGLTLIQDMPDLKQQAVEHFRETGMTYNHTELCGDADREVLVYNVPDFYVVHTEAVSDYPTLLEAITSSGP